MQSNRRRKICDLAIVEEVATTVKEKTSSGKKLCSALRIARALDKPVSMLHNILRNNLRCYPYKMDLVQELFPSNRPVREGFSLQFLARL